MKVLLFVPDLDGGGAQRTMVNLTNALRSEGTHEVRLAVGRTDGPGRAWLDSEDCLIDLGVDATRRALFPLRRTIRSFRPDLVFSSMLDANIVAALSRIGLSRRPRLITRETNSHRARGDLSRWRRLAARWTCHQADRVVALSRGVGVELCEDYGLDDDHVVTIHNPVDVAGLAHRANIARSAPGPFAADGPAIVAAGRLTRQKGFDLLIDAFTGIDQKNARLIILGDGPDRAALERRAGERGVGERVLFPGFVADTVAWITRADLFVLSSRWEGFGHVICEAMACGTPVIAFDCPHGPRDIIRDGHNGLLVPNGDVRSLSSAMRRLVSDTDQRLRLAGQARKDVERFRIDVIAEQYLSLIRAVAGDSPVPQAA